MSLWSLASVLKKRADLADVAWGFGFVLVAWIAMILSGPSVKGLALNLLVTIWAVRLATHIYFRNRHRSEDFRYLNLKKKWGKNLNWKIFTQVFLLQGAILYIVALPIVWIHVHANELSWSVFSLAFPFWLIGFFFETISDYQLSQFQKDAANKGKLLTSGLWSYVRHPNYLGELLQWWAIWLLAAALPWGWTLLISPLLLTFLIVKVSGIAPLEEKMKTHPDFEAYAARTPSLLPLSLVNGTLYGLAWFVLIFYGAKGSFLIPFAALIVCFLIQLVLFFKWDRKSFLICIPLSIYALCIGVVQEILFIDLGVLAYPNRVDFPPFWLLALYPLFSFTLHSSLSFLNRNLLLAFAIGGIGASFSYFSGEKLGGVQLFPPFAYPAIFISWGIYLVILVYLNRKLIALRETYADPQKLKDPVTVFFDLQCPICFREMETLKKRVQTGAVRYESLTSDVELKRITNAFSYKQAMEKIHAITHKGEILVGTKALSALYARTDLSWLAILMQAPGFSFLFQVGYLVWAKFFRL